ncbi:MAG: endolytic transglycosylase MltG [Deltaproteobacteria bacterium]|nr:endolytic transglycosylase MltG [Deltaproteobacteria bacterium]
MERPIISSVFHNRLKRGIRLESDPTVIYGINDFNGNITRRDLAEDTLYNTYRIKGLPPGPIANAGIEAIEAALYPADTRFLYFVSKKDNTHQFSTNLKDHNRAVQKYQLGR